MIELLQNKLKEELKSGNKKNINAYRNMIGKLKSKQIDSKKELTNEDNIKILQGMAKQIKDSIDQFKQGGRDDLIASEQNELQIIESFLPKQLTRQEIETIILNIINKNKPNGLSDLGKIMGLVMNEIAGKGDGAIASQIVREQLSK